MIRDTRGGSNRKYVNEDFFKSWSPKMAYVLGFMFADGSLIDSNQSSRTFYLSFYNCQIAILQAIRNCMNSRHKIYVKPRQIMLHKGGKYTTRTSYVLRLGNKAMYEDLLKLGMSHRKSNNMTFPNVPTNYLSYFIRGYLDGDGCIGHYLRHNKFSREIKVLFTSGSTSFLKTLSRVTESLIGISGEGPYASTGAYNLSYRGYKAIKLCEFVYHNLSETPYILKKYEKYTEYRDKYLGVRIRNRLNFV